MDVIEKIINHIKWLRKEEDGVRADLRGDNLSKIVLFGADLRGANLQGANLSHAKLRGCNFRGANLKGANLQGASLGGASFKGANIQEIVNYVDCHDIFLEIIRRQPAQEFSPEEWVIIGQVYCYASCWDDILKIYGDSIASLFDKLADLGYSEWRDHYINFKGEIT